jgi:hypothetical protein
MLKAKITPKTVNRATFKQERNVYELIRQGHNISYIMNETECSRNTVERLLFQYVIDNSSNGIQEVVKIGLGHRTEPYQTEHQMQALPTYTCTNAHMITPMRSDWKLYEYVDE